MRRRSVLAAVVIVGIIIFALGTGMTYASEKKSKLLRYAAMSSPKGTRSASVKWWASEIEKRTEGAITFKFFWSKALLKPKAALEGVGMGTANVGAGWGIYHPGKTPLWTVGDVPFSHADAYVGLQVFRELFKTYDPLINELKKYNVKLLAPFVTDMTQIGTNKKSRPIIVPDDSKGLKIRFAGGMWAKFWKACGAVPVKMTYGEVYEGLMRGTVDGAQGYVWTLEAYKLEDVIKNFTLINAGEISSYGIVINLDDWNAFSPKLQKIITEVSDEFVEHYAESLQVNNKRIKQASIDKGVKFFELNEQQKMAWFKTAEPFMTRWVDEKEAKGLPGKKTQDLFLKLVDKYQKQIDTKGYPWK
ncbi:MAG: C4-dicarboxylate TRAP transporter substrate-binding protein [Deltaproteobacteria bacterium]|nr:C4-dicarboxylate TRAP transporter substrate-binding protein [Deltaproteobacteria bacterium]